VVEPGSNTVGAPGCFPHGVDRRTCFAPSQALPVAAQSSADGWRRRELAQIDLLPYLDTGHGAGHSIAADFAQTLLTANQEKEWRM